MRKIAFLVIVLAIASCKQKETNNDIPVPLQKVDINELYALMQGSFNSQKQAEVDSSYYNISLHMYPIWQEQGHYLYVEQALNSMQSRPYRQRVYEITQLNDTILSSAVYTLPNDSLWVGKWKTPKAFDSISPAQLTRREGCAVLLSKKGDNHYIGATSGKHCKSTLRGAAYASSEVEIKEHKITSWDQGFDQENNQVWGAEKGGYVFNKLD